MKRKIFTFNLILIFVLCLGSISFAAETTESTDKSKYIKVGNNFLSYTDLSNDWYYEFDATVTANDDDTCFYLLTFDNERALNLAGVGSVTLVMKNIFYPVDSKDKPIPVDNVQTIQLKKDGSGYFQHSSDKAYLSDIYSDVVYSNSIPIFNVKDTDAINKYIDFGDYSGALNVSDLRFDEEIELPKDLKVTGGYASGISSAFSFDKDFVVNWCQTVDTSDYSRDVDFRCTFDILSKAGVSTSKTMDFTTSWVDYDESSYGGLQNITYCIPDDKLNYLFDIFISEYYAQYGKINYKCYMLSALEVRIRNKTSSGHSDFVVVRVDYNGSSTTATVKDEDDNIVDNDFYNNTDVSPDDDNSTSVGDFDIVSLLGYIRGGFGLLGNGGLISLMSGLFSFLPNSIWTLIKMSIAISITLMVFALVKKFVFG